MNILKKLLELNYMSSALSWYIRNNLAIDCSTNVTDCMVDFLLKIMRMGFPCWIYMPLGIIILQRCLLMEFFPSICWKIQQNWQCVFPYW